MTTAAVIPERTGSAAEFLRWGKALVNPALHTAVEQLPAPLRLIAGYHLGWCDTAGQPASADSGKAVRPTLALLAARAVGGRAEAALPAAVAVELVHNYSLLHDDIIDADRTRRHRATAWTVFGTAEAILTGDAMQALALRTLAADSALGASWLGGACVELCDGQFQDVAFENRTDVSVEECVRMAEAKTAALIGCACALGALLGGAEPERAKRFGDFGRRLGLAFQFTDDLLGIWGDPALTGKPAGADLARRKNSLPVIAALASGTHAGDLLADRYHRREPSGSKEIDSDAEQLAHLIEAAGARRWAARQAADCLTEAIRCLRSADAEPEAADALVQVANLMARRDR